MNDTDVFAAGRDFVLREGRLLERRLFATCFLDAPASGVVDALRGYENADGGFGHALEPDTRCPASLPIYVEVALQALAAAKTVDEPMVRHACDYLAGVAAGAGAGGAVPLAGPAIESYPRAAHWTDWTYQASLNPTAGLVGLCLGLGIDHAWVGEAAAYCWQRLDSEALPGDAHSLAEVFVFLEHAPDRDRADEKAPAVAEALSGAQLFLAHPDDPGYGLTPLHVAPAADSRWRGLFAASDITGHLDHLQQNQQPDGGWPIAWEPPGAAAVLEWRGIETLRALRTLASYGRLEPDGLISKSG